MGKIVSRQKDSEDDVVFKFRVSNESLYLVTLAEFVSFFLNFNDAPSSGEHGKKGSRWRQNSVEGRTRFQKIPSFVPVSCDQGTVAVFLSSLLFFLSIILVIDPR